MWLAISATALLDDVLITANAWSMISSALSASGSDERGGRKQNKIDEKERERERERSEEMSAIK